MSLTPQDVLALYLPAHSYTFLRTHIGAIQETYVVTAAGAQEPSYVLQKMHSIFAPALMGDIQAVTARLIQKGLTTQTVVPTLQGDLYVADARDWWRLLTFVPGAVHRTLSSDAQAHSAGALLGTFHLALTDLSYTFTHHLPHFHDTHAIMTTLRATLGKHAGTSLADDVTPLATSILSAYAELPSLSSLPKRVIHGDLKVSNICFDESGKAVALIDLDTLMRGPVALDVGDALRSWCATGDEDRRSLVFDAPRAEAALAGYRTAANFLTPAEDASLLDGMALITVELAARFITDALDQNYFVHDKSRYKSLYIQNKTRAENQFALYADFARKRYALE